MSKFLIHDVNYLSIFLDKCTYSFNLLNIILWFDVGKELLKINLELNFIVFTDLVNLIPMIILSILRVLVLAELNLLLSQ